MDVISSIQPDQPSQELSLRDKINIRRNQLAVQSAALDKLDDPASQAAIDVVDALFKAGVNLY